MNSGVAFTVCITLAFSYLVMTLHFTISTAIRAVDDNQVECYSDVLHCRLSALPHLEQ